MSLFTTFDHYNPPLGPDGTPYEYFEMLRDEALAERRPIGWSECYGGFWVVAGWAESRAIHENTTAFSNVATTFPPYSTPSGRPFMLSGQDEPEHAHYRKMVQKPFTRPSASKQIDQLRNIANMLIDEVAGKDRIDLCSVTDQMPGYAFCAIAGLSMSDAPKFKRFVHGMVAGALDPVGAAADMLAMEDYWHTLVEERRGKLAEGLLGEIINTTYDGKYLDDGELLDFFTVLLLGGFDNMLRFFGNAFYRLSWDGELRRRLARQPELIPAAVDELFRLDGPACTFRLVRSEVTVGGVDMKPGQIVGLIHPVCNRDPQQFEYPDAFLIDRKTNRRHMTFGLGIHHCLGAFLAHTEAMAMIEQLLRRYPQFELDRERPTHWSPGQVGGMHRVPVVLGPGS